MTKKELTRVVAKRTNSAQYTAAAMVDAVFLEIKKALSDGDKVTLPGFGTFHIRVRSKKHVYNPRTGCKSLSHGGAAPAFKASGLLREAVSGRINKEQ